MIQRISFNYLFNLFIHQFTKTSCTKKRGRGISSDDPPPTSIHWIRQYILNLLFTIKLKIECLCVFSHCMLYCLLSIIHIVRYISSWFDNYFVNDLTEPVGHTLRTFDTDLLARFCVDLYSCNSASYFYTF